MVGISTPPSLGVIGALGRDDAAHVAGAKGLVGVFDRLCGMAVCEPVHHRCAEARYEAHPGPHGAATQHQEPVAKGVPDADGDAAGGVFRHIGDAGALDDEVGDLGYGEDSQAHGNEGNAVFEIGLVQCPAQDARLRITADGAHEQADDPYDEALEGTAAAQHRNHGDAQHAQHEELWGAERQHQRAEHRHREGQDQGAEEPAHERRHVGGAERSSSLATLGHGVAVEDGGLGRRRSGDPEKNRRHRVGGADDRMQTDEHGEGREGIHVEGEGQQDRQAHDAAQAGNGPEGQSHEDPEREQGEPARDEEVLDGFECGFEHVAPR